VTVMADRRWFEGMYVPYNKSVCVLGKSTRSLCTVDVYSVTERGQTMCAIRNTLSFIC
jgi:hypothetical protein